MANWSCRVEKTREGVDWSRMAVEEWRPQSGRASARVYAVVVDGGRRGWVVFTPTLESFDGMSSVSAVGSGFGAV